MSAESIPNVTRGSEAEGPRAPVISESAAAEEEYIESRQGGCKKCKPTQIFSRKTTTTNTTAVSCERSGLYTAVRLPGRYRPSTGGWRRGGRQEAGAFYATVFLFSRRLKYYSVNPRLVTAQPSRRLYIRMIYRLVLYYYKIHIILYAHEYCHNVV